MTGLLQLLAFVLLLLTLLALVGVLLALERIRKALETVGRAPETSGGGQPREQPAASAAQPTSTRTGGDGDGQPEPARAAALVGAGSQSEPTATSEPKGNRQAEATAPRPQETRAGAEQQGEPQEEPFERDGRWWFRRGDELLVYDDASGQWQPAPGPQAGAAEPPTEPPSTSGDGDGPQAREDEARSGEPQQEQAEGAPDAVSAATEDAPENEPFERDGRWWFRRGDELLVYDEQSQEWHSAATEPSRKPAPPPQDATAASTQEPERTGVASATATEDESGFWECSSCGAVNGSTSSSCRMCFSPRS